MGSSLILKVRICLKTLKPLFHQGCSDLLVSPHTARFLCTRDSNPRQPDRGNSRQTIGQARLKNGVIRQRTEEFVDGVGEGRGKTSALRQRPSFPKSVFTAGTAKRTAEMLKRKTGLPSEDDGQHDAELERRASRAEGRRIQDFLLVHVLCKSSLYCNSQTCCAK